MSKTHHPIYALWSHPRSMSTAMERVMRERGDLDCAHEPFMYDYYVHREVRKFPHFDVQPDHPTAYTDIRDMLLKRAEAGPVFIKDMSYYVWPQIVQDEAIAPHLVNMFLIRDPVAAIASYYKLDPDLTLEEIGLEAQWHHFCALRDRGETPPIVDANAVRADTRGVLSHLWEAVGLPYVGAAFDWQSETPADWEQVDAWHGKATSTSGIQPISDTERQEQRDRFEAAAEKAPHLRDYLAHHQPFYDKLAAQTL